MKTSSSVFFVKRATSKNSGGKDPSICDIGKDVACDVKKIYNKTSILPLSTIVVLKTRVT